MAYRHNGWDWQVTWRLAEPFNGPVGSKFPIELGPDVVLSPHAYETVELPGVTQPVPARALTWG